MRQQTHTLRTQKDTQRRIELGPPLLPLFIRHP